jgi:signal transduction histidine kinase
MRTNEPEPSRRWRGSTPTFPWIGVGIYLAILIMTDVVARTAGLSKDQIGYLLAFVLASVALIALIYYVRLADSPPELRTLRILAVLLPSAFVVAIELILYFVEVDSNVSEGFEHIGAIAILSAGAVPFSVYVFRRFARMRDELAERAENLHTLHGTSVTVAEQAVPPELYLSIAHGARQVVHADRAALLYPPAEGTAHAEVVVPDGEVMLDAERELAIGSIEEGAMRDASGDGHADRYADASRLAAPVRRQGRPVGAIVVSRSSSWPFTDEERLLLDMFAVAASAGVENASRIEEAQLLATVEERERIARDLHDDLGQLLGFLTMKIQAAQELSAQGREGESREELARLEEATRSLGAQVREAILGLRASVGPDRPLGVALEEYLADFGIQAGLQTSFEGDADAGSRLPATSQYQLLRIAQEALSNARRHSGAGSVGVRLCEVDGSLLLDVTDDGTGFDQTETVGGFGLKTMHERASSLGAAFSVGPGRYGGTRVAVELPLDEGG